MRANELIFLNESRGVSARQPGDVYVSVNNPEDTLTIIDIKFVRPQDDYAFDNLEELQLALDQVIPKIGRRIEDNTPTSASRAAIVAEVETSRGKREYWVRYVQDLKGIHNKWKTFDGYKFQAAIESESLPIKPSDLIPDENPRTIQELIKTIHSNLSKSLEGTQYEHVGELIEQVIQSAAGNNEPIHFEKRSQAGIIAKYAGEYAGVIALMSDNIQNINIEEIQERYNTSDLSRSKVIFPQDTAAMLVDSYVVTPEDNRIGVSSKMYKAGGAASSLLGIYKEMPQDVARRYPKGATIVKDLATLPAYSSDPRRAGELGPVVLARRMKIINQQDIEEMESLDRNEQNPEVLKSDNLKQLITNQNVDQGTLERPEYSLHNHLLSAIINRLVARINAEEEFVDVINATLRETGYIQILTKVGLQGNNVTFTYYAKLPDNNKPFVYNKTYFATGNKGRIGFKMEK